MDKDLHRQHIELQLPGLEDQPLWKDYGLIISVPCVPVTGSTVGITYRCIDHVNYLAWERRECVLDQNTHVRFDALPALLDDAYQEYQNKVWRQIDPFL